MTSRAAALTLVEVLVAIALFALLATAVAGLWSAALRATAAAEATAARTRALEPYTVPASLLAHPPPPCGAAGAGGDGSGPCLVAVTRCALTAGRVRCEGAGGLGRFDLRPATRAGGAQGAAGGGGAAEPLRAWARWRP